MSGCDSKTENNIKASIEAGKALQEQTNIDITHNTNIETKKENYKTVSYYSKHKREREKKFKECEEAEVSTYANDAECDNALRAKQLEKRQNSSAFIHQDFLK
jgi:hypothetical protein